MSDLERKFHEQWLGMVQPVDGLVVSVPVLVDAQVMARKPPAFQAEVMATTTEHNKQRCIDDLGVFLDVALGITPDLYDEGNQLPDDLSLYVPEGQQLLKPTLALRKLDVYDDEPSPDDTPAIAAGKAYEMLVWRVADGLDVDKPETVTGPWEYPASAKFDRLLRACRVPLGLLVNGTSIRLMYAPHGESTGTITFRLDDMASVGGRPILDAFASLLSAESFFSVAEERSLPAIVQQSRLRQSDVTNKLAGQVFEALHILLEGFESASERDGIGSISEALRRNDDHLYGGLLTTLLRLVFLLYAEDQGLMPMGHPLYTNDLSVLGLFDQLQEDAGRYPDAMGHRFGAWPRLLALFRAVYLGASWGEGDHALHMPPRRGVLFNPHEYAFLEGWPAGGSAPIQLAEHRAAVQVPSIDDGTVYGVLKRLLLLDGQRLSYRALDVEQIGSVYEALMGYHVLRLVSPAVCIGKARVWVEARSVLEVGGAQREKWLKEQTNIAKGNISKVAKELKAAKTEEDALAALEPLRLKGVDVRRLGRLVLQPGKERRRTSSHYTPRSLTEPIVRKTLEPLLRCMGDAPSSRRLLNLKVCDPAMGSGAFLVECCRFLADQVVAAWTREALRDDDLGREAQRWLHWEQGDPVLAARRLVAQRCLYGVDKNAYAVNLAKLSLWMVTLAKELPFTFVDHALRHGDSLVGLSLQQIKSFHWEVSKQVDWTADIITAGLERAMERRSEILKLAADTTGSMSREKEVLLAEAELELDRAKLIGDLVVGAFFAHDKAKDRKAERDRRLALVEDWLKTDGPPPDRLLEMREEMLEQQPVFHWPLEFPEVFWEDRPDPLADDEVNHAAMMDAFVGNPPFLGGKSVSTHFGAIYRDWILLRPNTHGNGDLSAHFFRAAFEMLGKHGTMGLVSTNTIAQGDTRISGLQPIVSGGGTIFSATASMPWPGTAAVAVSLVFVGIGLDNALGTATLEGRPAKFINSALEGRPERDDPIALAANGDRAFLGCKLGGQGFLVDEEFLSTVPEKSAHLVRPYLGGEEVNSSPTQAPSRFVVDFAQMSLEEASTHPLLLSVVEAQVKPYRDQVSRASWRNRWWQFAEVCPKLRESVRELPRCLVTARVTKHMMFSWQPTSRCLNEKLYVFPFTSDGYLAVLQSRIHETWAWVLSSTMKNDLNYSASDCFTTFPFPGNLETLDDIGKRLDEMRGELCIKREQGLTEVYNQLKDADCTDADIVALRELHVENDRAVLAAYGWEDIEVPPYTTPTDADEEKALQDFKDEVIDRLFALNAERHQEERRLGLVDEKGKPVKKKKAAKKKAAKKKQDDLFGEGA